MKFLATLIATTAILVSGYVHGLWTERFGKGEIPQQLGSMLDRLPLQVGEWEGQDEPQQPSSIDRELSGSIQRRYVNTATGQAVTIVLLCGRPGPICIHTPDVCYDASGYEVGARAQIKVTGRDDEFWHADAVRTRASETTRLRIFWAWSHGPAWQAVNEPRADFARQPALLKLYVLRDLGQSNERPENDACVQFLQVFAPEVKRVLFSADASE